MPKEIIFKKSVVGGFNRDDVTRYIDTLMQTSNETQTSLKMQINHLTVTRDNLEKKLASFEDRLSLAEKQLEQKQQRINEVAQSEEQVQKELGLACRKLEKTQHDLSEREAEIFAKAKQYRELEGKVEIFKERSERYEQITASIGEVMLTAKTHAEKTVTEANKVAQRILTTAKNEGKTITTETFEVVDGMRGQLEIFKEEIDTLRTALNQTIATAENRIGKIYDAVDITINRLDNCREEFDDKINQAVAKFARDPIDISASVNNVPADDSDDYEETVLKARG